MIADHIEHREYQSHGNKSQGDRSYEAFIYSFCRSFAFCFCRFRQNQCSFRSGRLLDCFYDCSTFHSVRHYVKDTVPRQQKRLSADSLCCYDPCPEISLPRDDDGGDGDGRNRSPRLHIRRHSLRNRIPRCQTRSFLRRTGTLHPH